MVGLKTGSKVDTSRTVRKVRHAVEMRFSNHRRTDVRRRQRDCASLSPLLNGGANLFRISELAMALKRTISAWAAGLTMCVACANDDSTTGSTSGATSATRTSGGPHG